MEKLAIIPKPVSIHYRDGTFTSKGLPLIRGDSLFEKEIETSSGQLRDDFELMGENAPVNSETAISCSKTSKIENSEGYKLVITKDKITLEASDPAGMYHGLQTYRQLVLSGYKDGSLKLPCCEIDDYPRFSWRGFMLDCSRYFYSVPFIKKIIDIISLHHINRFHWHLTDDQGWRLHVAEYPLLTEIGAYRKDHRKRWLPKQGGFYKEYEIREIVEYAMERHVEIIPEVDLPGHASAILAAYPGLGCTGGPYQVEDRFGIFEDVLCAGNNQIFDLAAAVFDTLVKLFPSKWVHIGGDEVMFNRWEECPKCQGRLNEHGLTKPAELQSWVTQILIQMLSRRDRIAIGWDEILEDSSKFPLSKEAVIMSWRGDSGGIKAAGRGHSVIMSPNTKGCYLDHKHLDDPEEPGQTYAGIASVFNSYSMEPAPPEIKKEDAGKILGGQCNLWSELVFAGKIAEYLIFPRLCAVSEAVWTPKEGKDFEDFSKRLPVHRERLDTLGVNQYRGKLK
jgi:hexosaminidase